MLGDPLHASSVRAGQDNPASFPHMAIGLPRHEELATGVDPEDPVKFLIFLLAYAFNALSVVHTSGVTSFR